MDGGEVTMGGVLVPQVKKFKYLGSIVEERGDIDEDISHCIRTGWNKWRKTSGVLCDKKIPFRLNWRIYRMVVRPALFYGAECWPIKKNQVHRLMVAEMRMIRWMCGYTGLDRIRNVVIRERLGVAPLEDTLRETRLRWFGHVKRRSVDAPVRRYEAIDLSHHRRGQGRPKMSWNVVIRSDMKFMGLTEDIAQDRNMWQSRIKIVDHR